MVRMRAVVKFVREDEAIERPDTQGQNQPSSGHDTLRARPQVQDVTVTRLTQTDLRLCECADLLDSTGVGGQAAWVHVHCMQHALK